MRIWYAAHVILYMEFTDGNQDHYPVWENIYLLNAETENAAFEKAEAIGRAYEEHPDESFRWLERPARWKFGGVRKLTRCVTPDERPDDGTEVTYLEYSVRCKDDLKRLLDSDPVSITLDEEFKDTPPESRVVVADRSAS
jgi:hypothetical protein